MSEWKTKGELVLNCNCDVFCPCVASLGKQKPTNGYCYGWAAIRIDEGHYGAIKLDGMRVGLMLDIPGKMAEGNWKAALYVDESASDDMMEGLEMIFSGQAGGTTGLFTLLVSEFLGTKRLPISYKNDGKVRRIQMGEVLKAEVSPVQGADPEKDLVMTNTQYWMGADVTVAQAGKAKFRDFGRVWDLSGQSAELCQINWSGRSAE